MTGKLVPLTPPEEPTMTDDIDILDPEGQEIAVPGGSIRVSPIKAGQIPAILRLLLPIFSQLNELARGDLDGLKILELVSEYGDQVAQAVVIATGEPPERIAALRFDLYLEVVGAVIMVNKDFFLRSLTNFLTTWRGLTAQAA
jgi:hypothetical protein